jgi:hypothetical protein
VCVDVAALEPNAEVTIYPWKESDQLKAKAIESRAVVPEDARTGGGGSVGTFRDCCHHSARAARVAKLGTLLIYC